MKILQICSARDIGGGERHLADLANSLAELGHDVYAAVRPNAPLIGELRLPEENIFEVTMRGAADVLAAEKIAGVIRESKIDIIHAHMARDYPLAGMASARSGGTPFVLTRHVLFPMRRLHKLLLGRASRVIAVSNAVAGVLRKQGLFPSDKIVTIHNGIDTTRFARDDPHPSTFMELDATLVVGTLGHIAPIKGQDIFVRAAAIVTRERDDVAFVIIGEDKSRGGENRNALKRLIAELELKDRIRMLGWQADAAQGLSSLDIFVSAARSEPFGLAIVEAMAAGVMVIATATEGALEIIDDGVAGRLVPVGDIDALAGQIISLLADQAERKRLAANALRVVKERFSLEQMVDATVSIYDDAISGQ